MPAHQVISNFVSDTSKSVDIISDSMLNEIYAEGISHDGYVTIFRHPGATAALAQWILSLNFCHGS